MEYSLTGEAFQMADVTADQVLILPDRVDVTEGDTITDAVHMQALPIESFVAASAEEALSDALGLVLRMAVADGRISYAELLRVAPALEGRQWQPGLPVVVGDVYAFGAYLWRCIQPHVTQSDWPPDLTSSLWHKVEIIKEDAMRVWQAGVTYATGDVLAYPDAESQQYECMQGHTSQIGWEPPCVPALWTIIT